MKRLLIIILFLLPISAFADYQGRLLFRADVSQIPAPYLIVDNWPSACNASLDAFTTKATATYTARLVQISPTQCSIARNGTTFIMSISIFKDCNGTQTVWTGNPDGTAGVLTCTGTPSCPNGQTFSNGACQDPCKLLAGQSVAVPVNCSTSSFPSLVCLPNNCVGKSSSSAMGFDKTKSCYFGQANVVLTGVSCNGEPASSGFTNPTNSNPAPTAPETDCIKKGQSYGTVNGVVVCVPTSSSGATPITNTSNTTTTTQTRDTNGNQTANATKTQTETVSQDGQLINKTTQTKNPDGTVTTETTQQDYGQFCNQNPNHTLCKTKDEEKADVCEDNPDRPECFDRGEAEEGGPIGEQSKTVTFTPVSITSGGGCPADKSVSIAGRSITFSYSWLCQYASMFRPFMLAFAYLSAAMFLFWGYKGAQT